MMIDLINAHAKAGHKCLLITGRLNVRDTPLDPAVRIEKIIKYNRTTTFKRLATWIIGFLQIWAKIFFRYRREKLFLVSNPPLVPLLPLFVGNSRYSILIFDVFPDALLELGYLSETSFIVKWWKKANRKTYPEAEYIFTISGSMEKLIRQYSGGKAVKVVPLWTDNKFLKPLNPEENPFIEKYGLSGRFVVLYSGNIGLSGDVDVLLDIASEIDRDDIVFLIIGDGAKKSRLAEEMKERSLTNVIMLPWQPGPELPFSFASAGLAVVSLGVNSSMLAIPSKLYNYLSVGAPLMCICAKGSEVENLVMQYDCGRSFEPDNISGMVNYILEVADNRELRRGLAQKSLAASKNYSTDNVQLFFTAQ
ncbi:MAG: glycosyltransferase family 4 protein [Bacteroidales bacterium]|nr:glycosyltransferase family 4 protein [Bacteroidales bacterium]